jgi:peroxiredoxin
MIVVALLSISMLMVKKNQSKEKRKALTTKLPTFSTYNVRGNLVDNSVLLKNTPSVFIAFSPDCEHCQYEAKSINERQKDLLNTNIILFTSASDSSTKAFSDMYGLDTLKNVHVLSDKKDEMHKYFGVKTIPTIFIYNAKGKLVKQYKGETKIDAILKAIQ